MAFIIPLPGTKAAVERLVWSDHYPGRSLGRGQHTVDNAYILSHKIRHGGKPPAQGPAREAASSSREPWPPSAGRTCCTRCMSNNLIQDQIGAAAMTSRLVVSLCAASLVSPFSPSPLKGGDGAHPPTRKRLKMLDDGLHLSLASTVTYSMDGWSRSPWSCTRFTCMPLAP